MCSVHGVAVSGDAGSPLGPARSTSLCAYVSALYGPIGPATAHATGALILSPGTSRSTEVPAGVSNAVHLVADPKRDMWVKHMHGQHTTFLHLIILFGVFQMCR